MKTMLLALGLFASDAIIYRATIAGEPSSAVQDFKATGASTREADSGRGVLLLFTASWCGPCRQMKPELAALKANGWQVIDSANFTTPLESSVPIVLVDSDANPLLVWQHRVESLPCAVMLRGDREVARGSGYMDRWKLGELARTK